MPRNIVKNISFSDYNSISHRLFYERKQGKEWIADFFDINDIILKNQPISDQLFHSDMKETTLNKWICSQIKYLKTLSDEQIHALRSYIAEGYQLFNDLLRSNQKDHNYIIKDFLSDYGVKALNSILYYKILELIKSKKQLSVNIFSSFNDYTMFINNSYDIKTLQFSLPVYKQMIEIMINEINDIIHNSPSDPIPVCLYRGVMKMPKMLSSQWYIHRGFLSTSISIDSAKNFVTKQGSLIKLHLQPGIKCLAIFPITPITSSWEIEVLISSGHVYQVQDISTKKLYEEDEENILESNFQITNILLTPHRVNSYA